VPGPEAEPTPQPAVTEDGVSLDLIEAAMESRTKVSILEATSDELKGESGSDGDEEEFDLEKAMIEAGIDPENEDD
jgi:hypothetical protein